MHFFFSYFSDTLMTAAPTRINGDIESHQSCVSEPSIKLGSAGNNQTIIVELPGITNIQDAVNSIGKTSQLKFKEFSG